MKHYTGSIGSRWDKYWNPVTGDFTKAPSELQKRQWKSWLVLVSKAGDYAVTARGQGDFNLIVDGQVLAGSDGGTASATLTLEKGRHSVKVRSEGTATVEAVEVMEAGN